MMVIGFPRGYSATAYLTASGPLQEHVYIDLQKALVETVDHRIELEDLERTVRPVVLPTDDEPGGMAILGLADRTFL
jgi:hypothetical protein